MGVCVCTCVCMGVYGCMCGCVCVCVCMCVCMGVYVYVCVYMCVCMCVYMCMCVCMCVLCMCHVCVCVCMCVCVTYGCTCEYVYGCICVWVYVCVRVCVCMGVYGCMCVWVYGCMCVCVCVYGCMGVYVCMCICRMRRRFITSASALPLAGLRVLEMGQLIAGPFAGCILGYFGAEVIKIEPPTHGDALRNWRVLDDGGTSYWWRSMSRNKKCVTINLRQERGREIVHNLIGKSDVVLENFRPGAMEKWGLGPDRYVAEKPELVYTRVSGYGQTGPYRERPGFASVCEGYAGFRYVNGFPDEVPVRPNLSIGDTLAAMNAVIGTLIALQGKQTSGKGQVVDVSICESVFGILEGVVPEYDGAGVVREPSGTTLTGIAPTNTYKCADGKFVIIGGNGDGIFKRLCQVMGRNDLGSDPRFANNAGRVAHQIEVDAVIQEWAQTQNSPEILRALDGAGVPNGPINSVRDLMADPHFQARDMFEDVHIDGRRRLKIPAMVPKLVDTPGRTTHPGPSKLGAHNVDVFEGLLGMTKEERNVLEKDGVI